ncbi:MAG TPA: helix-turn-helix domain-containing protein [Streptosporangiaceae bacterium]|nr:helix-turn-helix domain-containing protein [Streptosporangiaceae bacterium]
MRTVDEVLAGSPLAGLWRVSRGGGDRQVALVRLAERFADLDDAPAGSLVVLSRAASAELSDYRLDMGLRWASANRVSAVAAFSAEQWQPTVTAMDIAGRADIALISIPAAAELAGLVQAITREIGGGAESALGRAEEGLNAVLSAEAAGAGLDELRAAVSGALGTPVEFRPADSGHGDRGNGQLHPADGRGVVLAGPGAPTRTLEGGLAGEVNVPVVVGEAPIGHLVAPDVHGDLAIAARLVLHSAAASAGRLLDLARRAREVPARSRSELLAELLMSESAINDDLLDRARQLNISLGGWHVAVRIEADDLDGPGPDGSADGPGPPGPDARSRDEVRRFELLEAAGQIALQAAGAAGGTWHLSRVARALVLIKMTRSDPGPQAGTQAARAAARALQALRERLPALPFRAGVGAAHEGPTGLRASAAEARAALLAARAARKPSGVAAHDVVGVQRMLMEWYASDTARASVRDQLAPLEKLGQSRADTAIRTLAAYLDEQGSIIKTAQRLHLHRNAVANRIRGITELLDVDFDDPDQRLALQLACRARLLG